MDGENKWLFGQLPIRSYLVHPKIFEWSLVRSQCFCKVPLTKAVSLMAWLHLRQLGPWTTHDGHVDMVLTSCSCSLRLCLTAWCSKSNHASGSFPDRQVTLRDLTWTLVATLINVHSIIPRTVEAARCVHSLSYSVKQFPVQAGEVTCHTCHPRCTVAC